MTGRRLLLLTPALPLIGRASRLSQRRGPEPLVVIGGKRKLRVRHLPDHRPNDAAFFTTLHLGDGMIDIKHRDERDTVEPVWNF